MKSKGIRKGHRQDSNMELSEYCDKKTKKLIISNSPHVDCLLKLFDPSHIHNNKKKGFISKVFQVTSYRCYFPSKLNKKS